MRAIVFNEYGGPEVLHMAERPLPRPGKGEVMIRIRAAALNPIDCEVRGGMIKALPGQRLPKIPGSDFAGVIEACGASVKAFHVGDRVWGMAKTYKGGAYATHIRISHQEIGLMPEKWDFPEAAAVPLAALTSLQALRDHGRLAKGESVLINGASGGVGTFAIQIAKSYGARVIAVCSHRNIELVQELGADEVIDYTQTDILKLDRQFDIFFDAYGNKSLSWTRHLLPSEGRYVSTIPNPRNFKAKAFNLFRAQKGSVVLVRSRTRDLDQLKTWAEKGQLKPVIDRQYNWTDAVEAQRFLETRRARGKVVLTGM
ncbi:MAG: NAD(P)-dependent alcohol dehydrogenase [Bacteroidota bacterium]